MNRSRSTALTPLLLSADATRETDEDCACPDGVFGVTLAATGGSLAQTPGISAQPLPGDHWLLHSPLAPGGPCVLNTAGYERWQGFAAPRPAADAFDHQLLRQALITPAGRRAVHLSALQARIERIADRVGQPLPLDPHSKRKVNGTSTM